MPDIEMPQNTLNKSSHEPGKQVWSTPTLRMLDISETNGAPGNPEGDGNAPFVAKKKIS